MSQLGFYCQRSQVKKITFFVKEEDCQLCKQGIEQEMLLRQGLHWVVEPTQPPEIKES